MPEVATGSGVPPSNVNVVPAPTTTHPFPPPTGNKKSIVEVEIVMPPPAHVPNCSVPITVAEAEAEKKQQALSERKASNTHVGFFITSSEFCEMTAPRTFWAGRTKRKTIKQLRVIAYSSPLQYVICVDRAAVGHMAASMLMSRCRL
jgi:hypothetical protein